jgi:uncharacterized protein YndB with AHSA1/START domain
MHKEKTTMSKPEAASNPENRDLVLSHDIPAPRRFVFEFWTNPKHVAQWWGPAGFLNPRCELDVRQGGAIRIDMRAPDGKVYPMGGFYQEVVEPDRLVFSASALDSLDHPLLDTLNTVTFEGRGDSTRIVLLVHVLRATDDATSYLNGMENGWKQSLDRLETYVSRVFQNARADD